MSSTPKPDRDYLDDLIFAAKCLISHNNYQILSGIWNKNDGFWKMVWYLDFRLINKIHHYFLISPQAGVRAFVSYVFEFRLLGSRFIWRIRLLQTFGIPLLKNNNLNHQIKNFPCSGFTNILQMLKLFNIYMYLWWQKEPSLFLPYSDYISCRHRVGN